ncbi:MAG: hypothetical protein Q9225_008053 [Loekoesia sp. 1 TL-2023]
MPTDNALVYELVQAIGNVIDELTNDNGKVSPPSITSRKDLIKNAERLAIAAREPEENLYFQATQLATVLKQNPHLEDVLTDSVF